MKYLATALRLFAVFQSAPVPAAELPGPTESGYRLPNGWQITPVGTAVPVNDLVTNLLPSPDGKFMLALSSGYNPHELVLINIASGERSQAIQICLRTP